MVSELQWKETEINKRPRRQKAENVLTKVSKREKQESTGLSSGFLKIHECLETYKSADSSK